MRGILTEMGLQYFLGRKYGACVYVALILSSELTQLLIWNMYDIYPALKLYSRIHYGLLYKVNLSTAFWHYTVTGITSQVIALTLCDQKLHISEI